MKGNVFNFRTLKHGDPAEKLKMLPDDLGVSRWRVWLKRYWFHGVVVVVFVAGMLGGRFVFF